MPLGSESSLSIKLYLLEFMILMIMIIINRSEFILKTKLNHYTSLWLPVTCGRAERLQNIFKESRVKEHHLSCDLGESWISLPELLHLQTINNNNCKRWRHCNRELKQFYIYTLETYRGRFLKIFNELLPCS